VCWLGIPLLPWAVGARVLHSSFWAGVSLEAIGVCLRHQHHEYYRAEEAREKVRASCFFCWREMETEGVKVCPVCFRPLEHCSGLFQSLVTQGHQSRRTPTRDHRRAPQDSRQAYPAWMSSPLRWRRSSWEKRSTSPHRDADTQQLNNMTRMLAPPRSCRTRTPPTSSANEGQRRRNCDSITPTTS
jgi:hypothetical protein